MLLSICVAVITGAVRLDCKEQSRVFELAGAPATSISSSRSPLRHHDAVRYRDNRVQIATSCGFSISAMRCLAVLWRTQPSATQGEGRRRQCDETIDPILSSSSSCSAGQLKSSTSFAVSDCILSVELGGYSS